ncbi:hypothetical protein GF312_02865 [Candidatus Poribacteria bacterium]|nr:hypothetical protein [Candidatus Poribacteria bacterium]
MDNLNFEQIRLIQKIGEIEFYYYKDANEEWQEAIKPGGWLYELKIRVKPHKPIDVKAAVNK